MKKNFKFLNLSKMIDYIFQITFYEFGKCVAKIPIIILCFSIFLLLGKFFLKDLGLGIIPSYLYLQFETKPERVYKKLIFSYGFLLIQEWQ
jgi:hypothetical protein